MTQHTLFTETGDPSPLVFGGPDVTPEDAVRLSAQLRAVKEMMSDHEWRTLEQIQSELAQQGIEAMLPGISARVRDLRKKKCGSLIVERQRIEGGLWRYRVQPKEHRNVT